MINVGCHFGPDDLAADVWDGLMALAMERQFMDRLVEQRREKHREQEGEKNKARAATGIPPPGGTIFQHKRPFR